MRACYRPTYCYYASRSASSLHTWVISAHTGFDLMVSEEEVSEIGCDISDFIYRNAMKKACGLQFELIGDCVFK